MSKVDGLVEPFTEHGHRAEVDAPRNRAVCTECPWFVWLPGRGVEHLRDAAYQHRKATTLR